MKAGQEIDALVAEKVMGWQWGIDPLCSDPIDWGWLPSEGDGSFIWRSGFNPSKDISHAWEVVEKFYFIDIRKRPKGYSVELVGVNGIVGYIGDSAPHAICIAALKAVGVNIE